MKNMQQCFVTYQKSPITAREKRDLQHLGSSFLKGKPSLVSLVPSVHKVSGV